MPLPSGTQTQWVAGTTAQAISGVSPLLTSESIVVTSVVRNIPTVSPVAYQATYYKNANQNLTSGSTDLTFDSVGSWNNDGGYITHTSGSTAFTVVQPGLYQLEFNATIVANGSTNLVSTQKLLSVDITRSPTAEVVVIQQNTTISSGLTYGQSLSSTFYLQVGDVINCRILNTFTGGPAQAQGVQNTFDLSTWFTWRYMSSSVANSVLSCYADNADGGSIYFNLALDPALYPIGVVWQVTSFEGPNSPVNYLAPVAVVPLSPTNLAGTATRHFVGTDYFVFSVGPNGAPTAPLPNCEYLVNANLLQSATDARPIPNTEVLMSAFDSADINAGIANPAYFIFGDSVPTGSILRPFVSQVFPSPTVTNTQSYPWGIVPDTISLYSNIADTLAPTSSINENASTLPTITLNNDNSITISGWAYGSWTGGGATPPTPNSLADDGIGGVRFTFVGPPPGPPSGSLVFYDNSYCFTATDLTNPQTARSFTIPAEQTRDFVNGAYRCFIDAGNCPTLEATPGSATYNQATWVAQAKFSDAIVVPFTFTRSAPLTPAQGPGVVLLTPGPTTIDVVADISNATDPSVNPAINSLTDVVFQYALITSGTPTVLSQNPTSFFPLPPATAEGVTGQITGLPNQTTYQVRVGITNGAPVASPVTLFSEWQLVTTLPFAPLVAPTLTSQTWAFFSTFSNVVNYTINTSACGGTTPYTSVGVYYSFAGPITGGNPGTFLPLTLGAPNVYAGAIPCPDNTPWVLYSRAQVVDSGGSSASLVPPVLNVVGTAPQALPPIGEVEDRLIAPPGPPPPAPQFGQHNIFPLVNFVLPPIGELPINYFCSASFFNDFSTLAYPDAPMVVNGGIFPGYNYRFVFKATPGLPNKFVFFRTNTFNAVGPSVNPSGVSPTFVVGYGTAGTTLPVPALTGGGTNTITITLTADNTTPLGPNTSIIVTYSGLLGATGFRTLTETAPSSGIYTATLSSTGVGAVTPDTYTFSYEVAIQNPVGSTPTTFAGPPASAILTA